MPFREIDTAMRAYGQITSNFLTQASWGYMRSDNLQLPCVQPPTSSNNLQLPHGCHSHGHSHGHIGHGGRG